MGCAVLVRNGMFDGAVGHFGSDETKDEQMRNASQAACNPDVAAGLADRWKVHVY